MLSPTCCNARFITYGPVVKNGFSFPTCFSFLVPTASAAAVLKAANFSAVISILRCITGCCGQVAITLFVKNMTARDAFDIPFAFVAFRMSLLAVIASCAELSIATKEFDIRDLPAQILRTRACVEDNERENAREK